MRGAKEIRKMTDPELGAAIDETKKELFNLRFQWESGQLEDYTRIQQLKKELARMLTIQHEHALAAAVIREEGADA